MKNTIYAKEAHRIIDLLKKDFVFSDGSFLLEKDGHGIFPHRIYADLGDFLPFFFYFGEKDFVYKQVSLYKKYLVNGLLISEFKSFGIPGLVKSYEYTDLLLGLLDLYLQDRTEENKKLLLDTVNIAVRIFNLDSNIRSFYYPALKLRLPTIDTRDGTFIEFFCDIYELTGEKRYLFIAENIYKHLISCDFYKKYHILPTFISNKYISYVISLFGYSNRLKTSIIMKNNTNTLFGFLSLFKSGKKEILADIWNIIDSLMEQAIGASGGMIMHFVPNNNPKEANLSASFAVIDFLCDLFFYTLDKKALLYARKIADFWIDKQGETGLFPSDSGTKESFLDAETDMTIALYKLWEHTGENKYKESADKCFEAIVKFHGSKDYPLMVDINTGKVTNQTQRTKFLALFLKLLILKLEYEKGKKIYSNINLWSLLRDR